jgi:hypothetical protein
VLVDASMWVLGCRSGGAGARTPFGPAPAGANGPRPYGCELTRSEPLLQTLRYSRLDNHRDSSVLIAMRSAVAP